ncbi:MAG: hypothetical protein ACRECO_06885 [Xanthobacteraceae bacterium]
MLPEIAPPNSNRIPDGTFPLLRKDKLNLQKRLESFRNTDHLGGVNELACWALLQHEGHKGKPVPTTSAASPDFQLDPPADCFVESLTLNLSEEEKQAFAANKSVALNHTKTIQRFFGKLTGQKQKQLKHAADNGKPGVLAVFDYTEWSGYGTEFFRALADALLGQQFAFQHVAPELSAILYLERRVIDGRIVLSRNRSAIYLNPLARHPLPTAMFPSLTEFSLQVATVQAQSSEPWLSL